MSQALGRAVVFFVVIPAIWSFVSGDNSASEAEVPSNYSPTFSQPYYPSTSSIPSRPLIDLNSTACLPYCE